MFNGFWETSARIAKRKQKIVQGLPVAPVEEQFVEVQYFDSDRKICRTTLTVEKYEQWMKEPADLSEAVSLSKLHQYVLQYSEVN